MPVPPTPANALPTIRAFVEGAAPHSADAASNRGSAPNEHNFEVEDGAYGRPVLHSGRHYFPCERSVTDEEFVLPRQNCASRCQGKSRADPGQFLDVVELLDDGGLDIGGDSVIESIDIVPRLTIFLQPFKPR
ncbi:uncharacterized protein PG986_001324 [Apiospora aurea]|uniref:Uncharacterized protein n=1 Tax=Apiospora aurea TaxID=335848 RepID=A0ABR1QWI4_9PEZI